MITPGPFAPKVTQWVAGTPTTDAKNNKVPAFTSRSIRVLAEFPGGSGSGQATSTELDNMVIADRVLLLDPSVAVSAADEFTLSDSLRYRVQGAPGRYRSPFTGTAVTQVNLHRIS